jgi:hypothetical protein
MWVVVREPAASLNTILPLASMVFAWQDTHPVRAIPLGCPENAGGMP